MNRTIFDTKAPSGGWPCAIRTEGTLLSHDYIKSIGFKDNPEIDPGLTLG